MQPKLELLNSKMVERILGEAFQLLEDPGVKVLNEDARNLLAAGGGQVDETNHVVKLPEKLVRDALSLAPGQIVPSGFMPRWS